MGWHWYCGAASEATARKWLPVQALADPLPIQLPTNGPAKGRSWPTYWALPSHVGDPGRIPIHDFCPALPVAVRKWTSRWKSCLPPSFCLPNKSLKTKFKGEFQPQMTRPLGAVMGHVIWVSVEHKGNETYSRMTLILVATRFIYYLNALGR